MKKVFMNKIIYTILALFVFASTSSAQLGIFDQTADWGPLGTAKAEGEVNVDGTGTDATYELFGNGNDIWGVQDEGFFVFSGLEGSWMLQGKVAWLDPGPDANSKIGFMVRENPTEMTSRYYWVELRGNEFGDQTHAQWRPAEGANAQSAEIFEDVNTFDSLEAEADGIWLRVIQFASTDRFVSQWSRDGETWTTGHSIQLEDWADSSGYGIAITSHTDDDLNVWGEATGVELVKIPFEANRNIPTDSFQPGSAITGIEISVSVAEGESPDATITETPPEGWEISNIQTSAGNADVSGNSIVWSISGASGDQTMTYDVTPPADASSGQWTGSFSGDGIDFAIQNNILTSSDVISVYLIGNTESNAQRNTIYMDLLEEGLTVLDENGNEIFIPGLGYEAAFITHEEDDPTVAASFDLVIAHESVSSNVVARYIDLPVPYLAMEQIFYAGRADREASLWFAPQGAVSAAAGEFDFIVENDTHPITNIYSRDDIVPITNNPDGQIGGITFDQLAPVAIPLMVSADLSRVTLAVAEEGETGLVGNDGLTPPDGSEPLPARRAMLGLHEAVQAFDLGIDGDIANIALTPEAAVLFQRVVQWMVGVEPTADGTEGGVSVLEWSLY